MTLRIIIFLQLFHCLLIGQNTLSSSPFVVILGNIQDAGSPHMGCEKSCCKNLFENPDPNRKVISLGIVDPIEKKYWMIEATPDFTEQCSLLKNLSDFEHAKLPDAIFLTHGHIGHYTGLMYLGRESYNSENIPIYAMTRMKGFLIQNGPWSQLIRLKNIKINNIDDQQRIELSSRVSITPFLVPHRDEFSETVGYEIKGPKKTILFIPDIDKWGKWNQNLLDKIKEVDVALVDGTFYDAKEVNYRDISEIPHPFVVETMELFKNESYVEKSKIKFIHLNHTNPLIDSVSYERKQIQKKGFSVGEYKGLISL
jgi:pyrroloquinoline quinone biosynthesis protein B|tara:strand:+ start:256 stop:1191 length:936 start_codon:yes stop_codon:yes gene_type:complete